MNILVIEDNDLKFGLVGSYFSESFPNARVTRAASYQSGVEALVKGSFDCVILDMTLPSYDTSYSLVGTDVLTFGGECVLRESKRRKIAASFIVLSQYDSFVREERELTFQQLRVELEERFSDLVIGCVRLDSTSVSWKAELSAMIEDL